GPDIKMKPGDYVVYENNQIEKKVITKNDYLVWTQNKLVFDNTKMSEVAVIIKEHYGVDVKIDSGIADKTITGIMPNDNLEVLLSSLEGTQEFRITRTENGITINKNQ
ncbi:MAG: FecR domain-containing protein, partial [Ginsengibacter sp.]